MSAVPITFPVPLLTPQQLSMLAASINDSDALMRVYAAPEWGELDDDSKAWVCALVRETLRRAATGRLVLTFASGGSDA